jgi:hypothetical protein
LVRAINFHVSEQIRIYLVIRVWTAGLPFWVYGFQPHETHQPLYTLTVDFVAQPPQMVPHGAAAPCRRFEILFIDKFHQFQVYGLYRSLFIVIGGPIDIQQMALSGYTQILMGRIDHFLPLIAL